MFIAKGSIGWSIVTLLVVTFLFDAGIAAASDAQPQNLKRPVPGWPDRPYELHIPTRYVSSQSIPVVLVLHGGGGNSASVARLTCPDLSQSDPRCFERLADREGFAVVYPNGTPNPIFRKTRTFNAGGGKGGFACISDYACRRNVDDVQYVRDLLNDLSRVINVDRSHVYATGISNGAAMSHRLACELSDRIAAIAPIAGGNQLSAVAPCTPARAVSVCQFHGLDDPAWPYQGGSGRFGPFDGRAMSIPDTITGWVTRDQCQPIPVREELPIISNDGTTVIRERYTGCRDNAEIVLYTIRGGGHTWPDGFQYAPEAKAGRTTRQINANEIMWEFFKRHPIR